MNLLFMNTFQNILSYCRIKSDCEGIVEEKGKYLLRTLINSFVAGGLSISG